MELITEKQAENVFLIHFFAKVNNTYADNMTEVL